MSEFYGITGSTNQTEAQSELRSGHFWTKTIVYFVLSTFLSLVDIFKKPGCSRMFRCSGMFLCSGQEPMFPCSGVFRRSSVAVFWCCGILVFRCSGVPVFRRSNTSVLSVAVFRCSGVAVLLLLVHAIVYFFSSLIPEKTYT